MAGRNWQRGATPHEPKKRGKAMRILMLGNSFTAANDLPVKFLAFL